MTQRDLMREIRRRGWTVEQTGGGHYRLRQAPDGPFIIIAFSPSCHRGTLNTVARIKRMFGVDLRDRDRHRDRNQGHP